jgi:hypothetical protein
MSGLREILAALQLGDRQQLEGIAGAGNPDPIRLN